MHGHHRLIAIITAVVFFTQTVSGCATVRAAGNEPDPLSYSHQSGIEVGDQIEIKTNNGEIYLVVITRINEDSYDGYIEATNEYLQIAFADIQTANHARRNTGLLTFGAFVLTVFALKILIEEYFDSRINP